MHKKHTHLRPILIAPVEDKERVRLAKEVLFIQFVGTELHGCYVLEEQQQFVFPDNSFFKYGVVHLDFELISIHYHTYLFSICDMEKGTRDFF